MRKQGLILLSLLLMGCQAETSEVVSEESTMESVEVQEQNQDMIISDEVANEPINQELEFVIPKSEYIRKVGNPSNFYVIDNDNTLWGQGRNNCGQLAQGTSDYEFHNQKTKIAENVIHVDLSDKGFMIFLTEDNKLYGVGNAGSGALQQYAQFDWDKYINEEHYTVCTPYLLMEDVQYAICGRDDVVAIKTDGTVWTWGTIYVGGGYLSSSVCYIEKPTQILENAIAVTGGWFNHAALLSDGTVWTWGYNTAGNCGVEGEIGIVEPVCVAQDVMGVWTGKLGWFPPYEDIEEFSEIYPVQYNNTIIQKADGTFWVCGENVGSTVREVYGAEANYTVTCSSEFYQIDSVDSFIQSVEDN